MKQLLLGLSLLAGAAGADDGGMQLKDGPGRDKVMANCATCHSLDYIRMNSVFLDHKGWEATVNKMIKAMGAPIKDEDVAPIVDYLSAQYGK